ncbi:HEXXH motif-containing putative peptide modification protein [Streptomyces sp. NPDC047130]|uniref:aKG-HExxH-type peptide beta-hydroxylase n=1 Tax=Streptomyces sp. NPDC047130 TaxID=3155261 RepID=UPI0033D7D82F
MTPAPAARPAVPGHVIDRLARTESDEETLDLLVHGQHTRRLLLLRLLHDTVTADAPPGDRSRFLDHWSLLEAAEGQGPAGRETVRSTVQHPLTGPWIRQALADLRAGRPADVDRLGAMAVAAGLRAGLTFTTRLHAGGEGLHLPTLGALTCERGAVEARSDGTVLRLRPEGSAAEVTVCPQPAHGAWAAHSHWRSVVALPPLAPGHPSVPLDDQGPYRHAGKQDAAPHPAPPTPPDDTGRKRWYEVWTAETAELLDLGHPMRLRETARLLRSVVPLLPPRDAGPAGYCSGTRRGAFGAVYSSVPPTTAGLASMLVHELQHAKLSALADLVPLHHAGPEPLHFAPWRPDPRPFDGLWQGIYSHLALAFWWRHCALVTPDGPAREHAWAEYARCREQTGAVLPDLVGSEQLTYEGRRLADGMVAAHQRLQELDPPSGHLARARSYIQTARALWSRAKTV